LLVRGMLRFLPVTSPLYNYQHVKNVNADFHIARAGGIYGDLFGGVSSAVIVGGGFLGITDGETPIGVARATGGVPVLVCNPDSNCGD
jgi:hypothetical protein